MMSLSMAFGVDGNIDQGLDLGIVLSNIYPQKMWMYNSPTLHENHSWPYLVIFTKYASGPIYFFCIMQIKCHS